MKAKWSLPLPTLALALLLGLPAPVTADAVSAGDSPAAAPGDDATVVDMADAVIPNANHYKCYPILAHTVFNPRRVWLRDQFWNTAVWVVRPRYLCNPVWKTTEDGTTYEPPQPDAHLVCYEIREDFPTRDWEVRTYDQFGGLTLKGNGAELLCLPAAKYVIVPPS